MVDELKHGRIQYVELDSFCVGIYRVVNSLVEMKEGWGRSERS